MNCDRGIRFKGAGMVWRKEGDAALSFSVQDIALVAPAVLFIQDISNDILPQEVYKNKSDI